MIIDLIRKFFDKTHLLELGFLTAGSFLGLLGVEFFLDLPPGEDVAPEKIEITKEGKREYKILVLHH